jgi:hypothetical protein
MGNFTPTKTNYLGYANLALDLYGLKQRHDAQELQERELAMKERFGQEDRAEQRRINQMRYGQGGIEDRRLNIADRQQQTEGRREDREEREQPPSQRPFTRSLLMPEIAKMKSYGLDKAYKPLIDYAEGLTEVPNSTRGRAYLKIKTEYPRFQKMLINNLQKEIEKGATTNPDFLKTERGQMLLGEIQAIEEDKTGEAIDNMFPMVKREFELEALKRRVDARTATAPNMKTYVNPLTGATSPVNIRDAAAVAKAEKQGEVLVGPEQRGYLEKSGRTNAEREAEIVKGGSKARGQITTLKNIDSLLDRFESGRLAGAKLELQRFADAFGMPVDVSGMAAKEGFQSIANELALRSRNLGDGMMLAGQMSERDVTFLKEMNPQLISSKAGNRLLIKMRIKMAERQEEAAKLVSQFKKENGGIFRAAAFNEYVSEKLGNQSVFGIPDGSTVVGDDDKTGLPVYKTKDGKLIIPDF